ncbi:Hypothetical predicted protein, partial [Podarcis lilfordi]
MTHRGRSHSVNGTISRIASVDNGRAASSKAQVPSYKQQSSSGSHLNFIGLISDFSLAADSKPKNSLNITT